MHPKIICDENDIIFPPSVITNILYQTSINKCYIMSDDVIIKTLINNNKITKIQVSDDWVSIQVMLNNIYKRDASITSNILRTLTCQSNKLLLIIHVIMTYYDVHDIKNIILKNIFDYFGETRQLCIIVDGKWFQLGSIFGSTLSYDHSLKIRSRNINEPILHNLTYYVLSYLKNMIDLPISRSKSNMITINTTTIIVDISAKPLLHSHIVLIFDSKNDELIYFPIDISYETKARCAATFTDINFKDIHMTLLNVQTNSSNNMFIINKINLLLNPHNAVHSWTLIDNELIY